MTASPGHPTGGPGSAMLAYGITDQGRPGLRSPWPTLNSLGFCTPSEFPRATPFLGGRDPPPGGPEAPPGAPIWGPREGFPGSLAGGTDRILGARKKGKNCPFSDPCDAKSRGSGGAPPTHLILLRNQWLCVPRRDAPRPHDRWDPPRTPLRPPVALRLLLGRRAPSSGPQATQSPSGATQSPVGPRSSPLGGHAVPPGGPRSCPLGWPGPRSRPRRGPAVAPQ